MTSLINKKLSSILFATMLVLLAAGCSTVRGVGRDISHTGDTIERAAR